MKTEPEAGPPTHAGQLFPGADAATRREAAGPGSSLLRESTARRVFAGTLLLLGLIQLVYLVRVGNGLPSPAVGDPHSEADLVRSAAAYSTDGLASHHGLPRIMYGALFPRDGIIKVLDTNGLVPLDLRKGFPDGLAERNNWVYTHYPPGPNLLGGVLGRVFGFDHLWLWRLLPMGLGFLALVIFFRTLARAFGTDRGALITAGCCLLPTVSLYMGGLHFQGYAVVLLLLQWSVWIECLWGAAGRRLWHGPALFLLGFLQGWLSFDLFFIVCWGGVPLWLLRRSEGHAPPARWLGWAVVLPLAGFVLAHGLHFLQVAGELGGVRAALMEFRSTAAERAGSGGSISHLGYLAEGARLYLREFLNIHSFMFGPFLLLALAATVPVVLFRTTRVLLFPRGKTGEVGFSLSWPGRAGAGLPLAAALLLCLAWLAAMPQHVVGNSHITLRQFFYLYFCLVLVIVRSLVVSRPPPARP